MKTKFLVQWIIASLTVIFISSCLNIEDEEKTYTAAEEILMRNVYLDSLINRGHDIDTTENGVYYVVIEEGEGQFAKSGDTLTLGYAGYYINGVMFDSSEIHYANGKMEFVLEGSNSRMIPGWEDGMKVMNKGTRTQFIIPSEMGYGSTGYGSIPPYQTLIFVIKLYDIKPS